ncbi:MAG: ABC transporter ATP-binding protein [Nitrospirae bacterium]|nr:ABC transporter ATP-binding protein [Nitrospirota bacterium]
MKEALLEVKDLKTYFYLPEGIIKAVDGINISVRRSSVLGIVGESGCGKSMTALSILNLVPHPPGKIVSGEIIFEGQDILRWKESGMRTIRGAKVSMIFQEPMTALNPVFTIGEQIAETLRVHKGMGRREAMDKAVELLDLVRIPSARERIKDYPHQLSGGMRQRVMIAMAISCNPSLIIADEPTTALDVTVQAQVLELLMQLMSRIGMSMILITHDLGVIAEIADDVAVMYAGRIVEYTKKESLFIAPTHPYTEGLLSSIPRFNGKKGRRLKAIAGVVPMLLDLPEGCKFFPRCGFAIDRCEKEEPPLKAIKQGHLVRCWVREGNYIGVN